jgi:hypothetical protein
LVLLRGHTVDESDLVALPADLLRAQIYDLLAAHAPSEIRIQLDEPRALVATLDDASWRTDTPTIFTVDERQIAALAGPQLRSPEILLDPGVHILRSDCPFPITRRYPVWCLRRLGGNALRIVLPTSNRYIGAAKVSLELLRHYWPGHPRVDVVCHERQSDIGRVEGRQIYFAGPQATVSWTEALAWYFTEQCDQEIVLLMLDDYGMCARPDMERIERALYLMEQHLRIGSIRLTGMALPHQVPVELARREHLVQIPKWGYSVNTQASLWRRTTLLRFLMEAGPCGAAEFEHRASSAFNRLEALPELHLQYACDPQTPLFLDSDPSKTGWTLPYNNLMHQGQPDSRHKDFLVAHGFSLSDLLT